MPSSKLSRYGWKPVRSNRHKTGKKSAVTVDHLLGRHELLRLDLLDITRAFGPHEHRVTLRDIAAEMTMIEEEFALRLKPAKKTRAKVKPVETFNPGGLDELAGLAASWDEEED